MKRRQQLEEALKNSGAPPEALRILNGNCFMYSLSTDSCCIGDWEVVTTVDSVITAFEREVLPS